MGRSCRDPHRRRHEPVSPLLGLFHRADPGAALHARRLRPLAQLPSVSGGGALPQPYPLVGRRPRSSRRRDTRLRALRRRRFHRSRHRPAALGRDRRLRLHRASARGDAAHDRADHARRRHPVHPLRDDRAVSAAALDASRLRSHPARRAPVHHPGGDLRGRGRRLVDAHHPVHDLRRLPGAIGRRQVLHRLLARPHGRQAEQRRPHRGAVVVPPRRAVGLRRRDDRHDRHRRLSDDGQGRLRAERGRRASRGRRPRRHPVAAGARRRRLPDRRVPEDLLSRRDLDGGHPDLSLLPVAARHGGARRAPLRRARRRVRSRT